MMKWEVTDLEETFINHISDRGSLSGNFFFNSQSSAGKKAINPIRKLKKDTGTFLKWYTKWKMSTGKGV